MARRSSAWCSPAAPSSTSRKPTSPTTRRRSRWTCSWRRAAARGASSWWTGVAASATRTRRRSCPWGGCPPPSPSRRCPSDGRPDRPRGRRRHRDRAAAAARRHRGDAVRVLADALGAHARALLRQAREPADDGLVQGARRREPPAAARPGGAAQRRHRRQRRQPRPRRRLPRRAARHPGHDRDAGVRAAHQGHLGVQSAALPAMARSLECGERLRVAAGATIADGIAVRQVGKLTLDLVRQWVDRVVTVDEEELANAVLLLLEIEKTVVEGAGAAPLAALLNRRLDLEGRRVALVLSGGNIDVTMLARIIERGLVKDGRLVRLGVLLRDIPGALARLTAVIAEERANILQILHDRAFSPHAAIGQTKVELTLETSGPEQIAAGKRRPEAPRHHVEERQ